MTDKACLTPLSKIYFGQQLLSRHTSRRFHGENEVISTNIQTDLVAVLRQADALSAHATHHSLQRFPRAIQVILHTQHAILNIEHSHRTGALQALRLLASHR